MHDRHRRQTRHDAARGICRLHRHITSGFSTRTSTCMQTHGGSPARLKPSPAHPRDSRTGKSLIGEAPRKTVESVARIIAMWTSAWQFRINPRARRLSLFVPASLQESTRVVCRVMQPLSISRVRGCMRKSRMGWLAASWCRRQSLDSKRGAHAYRSRSSSSECFNVT